MVNYEKLRGRLQRDGFDVDTVVDGLGRPIDAGIKPLVTVLNHMGYRTTQSCEGHALREVVPRVLRGRGYEESFKIPDDAREVEIMDHIVDSEGQRASRTATLDEAPWVDLVLSSRQERRLQRAIKSYNSSSACKWSVNAEYFHTTLGREIHRLKAVPEYPISEMQRSVHVVAEHLYSSRGPLRAIATFFKG